MPRFPRINPDETWESLKRRADDGDDEARRLMQDYLKQPAAIDWPAALRAAKRIRRLHAR